MQRDANVASTDERSLPEGLVLRPWRDAADFETMAVIANATREVDARESVTDATQQRLAIEGDGGIAEQSVTIAELDGVGVGWALGVCNRSEDGARWLLYCRCRVLAEHRGRGIGTALAAHAEAAALRDTDRRHPDDGYERVFECWLEDGEHDALALLEKLGYRPVRWGHHMTRSLDVPIPDAPLPQGIEIRPVTSETARQVLLGFDEASRDTWEYNGLDEAALMTFLEHPIMGKTERWVAAWEHDTVVAGILGWIDQPENEEHHRRRGYVERIWTRRPWRGRGIAGALIAQNLRDLRDAGMSEAALSVDADSPSGAGTLYERMGFRRVGGLVILRRPAERAA
jgi:mycothiol synthase